MEWIIRTRYGSIKLLFKIEIDKIKEEQNISI